MHASRSLARRLVGAAAAAGLLGGLITVAATNSSVGAVSPSLVINEIDYDQPSTDTAEFLELYNPTTAAVDMSGFEVELVNGTGGGATVYNTIALTGSLAAGDYFVICANAATVANCDLDASPNTNFIQNGAPDAVGLRDGGGALLDAVSYEGDAGAPYTEGSGAGLVDNSSVVDAGIARCADGVDTDQNNADLLGGRAITPGAANDCPVTGADPVINEFVANHTGSDTEAFVEVLGDASTDYSTFTVLEIEGDGSSTSTAPGRVDAVLPVGTTNGGGYWIDPEDMENGTITILLVEGFSGSNGQDLDTNNDGTFDVTPWTRIVDDVATTDGGSFDITYSSTVLGPFFDGNPFGAGGASRIPNGTDTDTTADWLRNDFDGFGFPGFPGSPALGEAVNTPDAENEAVTVPTDPVGVCGDPATYIHDIQGAGLVSDDVGSIREIEGVVVGDFLGSTRLNGFFVQEEDSDADGDAATSEGIFVFYPSANAGDDPLPAVGTVVRVRGSVSEFFGLTQINNVERLDDCATPDTATPATLALPVASVNDFETMEGMGVSTSDTLYASGNFNQARFGEVDLSVGGPLDNPTNVVAPGAPANALQDLNNRSRIQLDDGSNVQNPLPLPPYLGDDNTLRTGDTVTGLSAVMSYSFGVYELHPTASVDFSRVNDRPTGAPDVGGSMTVAAYNVLNYFTTIDDSGPICGPLGNQGCRGADTADELVRQRDKIVSALAELDADVVGLMEIENPRLSAAPDDAAIEDLVDGEFGLNSVVGAGTYDYVDTGTIGGATGDAIKVAMIYKPANVTPIGAYEILDSSVDPLFDDTRNRPALAQTFQQNGTDDLVTVAVNHLKSKGSNCNAAGDPDTGDGQGNCNVTRTNAATALASWLAGDPTGSGSTDNIIVGDLNAYAMEDPIVAIESAGYTDLVEQFVGAGYAAGAYSFNFSSQSGYLDHALASPSAQARVTGTDFWHVNADEPRGLDYNNFNQPGLYNPDPFRSSDHDPVVVGICEATPPVVSVNADPDVLWPPNHKYVEVSTTVDVTDADPDATVTLVSVTSNEPDNATGNGDGNTVNDIVIVDDNEFQLRAERSGTGDGRVYTITYEVTDGCGNSTIASATVNVPKSK